MPGEDMRSYLSQELETRFAAEDAVLRAVVEHAHKQGVPPGQISPHQGKLLQVLMIANKTRRVLEIGTLTGYSAIWMARALPADGRLITLEANPTYADLARQSFASAGMSERVEVRIGAALDLLPALQSEAPFDLIFLDADKKNNIHYLEWALQLSRVGTLIIADNIVRNGKAFQTPPPDESSAGVAAYIHKILAHPHLVSTAIMNDDAINGIDGFSISVVNNTP